MKKLKKQAKKAAAKGVHAFGVFLMVIQTLAMPITYGVAVNPAKAIAADSIVSPQVDAEQAVAEAPAPSTESVPADETEEKTVTETSTVETGIPAETVDTPVNTEESAGTIDSEAASIVVPDEIAAPETATPAETVAPIVTEAASNNATAVSDRVCLGDSAKIETSQDSDWNVDGQNVAETKEKVELGVKYEFPLNKDVSVTFTCLPTDETKLSTLKIEQIATSSIDFPEGIIPAYDFAYDITTGMDNGDFKYDLTLPKPETKNSDLSYIEKTSEEAQNNLSKKDIKEIDKDDISVKDDSVKISDLDHFTIFVFTTTLATFTIDSDTECINDSDGPNDEPGQKDLNQLCRDQATNDLLDITWNWDEILMTGSNTDDACALFDTDPIGTSGYGFADYSLCAIWDTNQHQITDSPRLYSCNDTRTDRCQGSSQIAIGHGSTCLIQNSTDDPFPGPASKDKGSEYPNDTKAICSIDLDDVGGNSQAELLDVCSYPSGQPNSYPSDCVVISADKGNLEVVKNVVPDNATTNWIMSISGNTSFNDTLHGDDSTGIHTVNSGNGYTITETAGLNTSLANYDTTYSCTKNGSAYLSGIGTFISGISIAKTDLVICTFTNTLKTGTVIVHKDVQGPNGEDITDTSQNFTVQLDSANSQSITDNGTVTYSNVIAGAHTISESFVPTGYSLYSITGGGNINVTAGGTTDVYIVNQQNKTTLKLIKTVTNNDGGTKIISDFVLKIDGNTVTSGVANEVSAGAHTASEVNLSGYTASSWGGDCNSDGTISLTLGDSKTCTITNDDQPGTLIVRKVVTNDNGGNLECDDFSFAYNAAGAIPFETDCENQITVPAGTYNVTEPAVSGYATGYSNCSGMVIPNGGSATCTITNDDQTASLTVIKHVVNDNGGTKNAGDFTMNVTGANVLPSASFAGAESPGTTVTLDAGSYSVDETPVFGYGKI